jgi:uncharacterized membrane protein
MMPALALIATLAGAAAAAAAFAAGHPPLSILAAYYLAGWAGLVSALLLAGRQARTAPVARR